MYDREKITKQHPLPTTTVRRLVVVENKVLFARATRHTVAPTPSHRLEEQIELNGILILCCEERPETKKTKQKKGLHSPKLTHTTHLQTAPIREAGSSLPLALVGEASDVTVLHLLPLRSVVLEAVVPLQVLHGHRGRWL